MMLVVLWLLLGLSMTAVVASLVVGLANSHNPLLSQKMMRLRVVSQAFALIIFAILLKSSQT